jgi:hypothetical protein
LQQHHRSKNNTVAVTFCVQGLQTIYLTTAVLVVTPGDYPKDSVAQQVMLSALNGCNRALCVWGGLVAVLTSPTLQRL